MSENKTTTVNHKPRVALDFDGVLNTYEGWRGEGDLYAPRPDVQQFLALLDADYWVTIHSTREPERIREWLEEHGLSSYVRDVTSRKPPALAYIDDRAIRFDGDYGATLVELSTFKPYWEKENKE